MLENRTILITGGAGSIGSELVRQLAHKNKVIIFDTDETRTFDLAEELKLKGYDVQGVLGDVRNVDAVKEVGFIYHPDVTFHCAALKHVTPSEMYPREYIDTNIIGTLNVMKYIISKKIFISTDKVVNAACVMGLTKKLAEHLVRKAGYIAVRFGNVLGSRGSVIPIWQGQIDKGEPLTVTDARMERYVMTIEEACSLVIKAAEIGEPGQCLILDMGKRMNILQMAKDIIAKSGRDIGIRMIGTRPGEVMDEKLMTPEEELVAVKKENFYVLPAR